MGAEIQLLIVNSNQGASCKVMNGSDTDLSHASMNGSKGILQLGNHTASYDAIGNQS